METFILGVAIGTVVGYAIRALISRVHHRRFEEDYGYNPHFPPGDRLLAPSSETFRLDRGRGRNLAERPAPRPHGTQKSWKWPSHRKAPVRHDAS